MRSAIPPREARYGADAHKRDFYVTKAGVTRCRVRTLRPNGLKLTWLELEAVLASKEARVAALKAARAV